MRPSRVRTHISALALNLREKKRTTDRMSTNNPRKYTCITHPQALHAIYPQIRPNYASLLPRRHPTSRSRMVYRLHPFTHKGLDLLVRAQVRLVIEVGPCECRIEDRRERLRAGDAQAQLYPTDKFGEVFRGGYVAINGLTCVSVSNVKRQQVAYLGLTLGCTHGFADFRRTSPWLVGLSRYTCNAYVCTSKPICPCSYK